MHSLYLPDEKDGSDVRVSRSTATVQKTVEGDDNSPIYNCMDFLKDAWVNQY